MILAAFASSGMPHPVINPLRPAHIYRNCEGLYLSGSLSQYVCSRAYLGIL